MVINLIATPRNISTALMYSFAQHPDVKVVDEPFYAYYLALSDTDHPCKDAVMKELPQNMNGVLNLINTLDKEHPVVFVKNMTHHLLEVHNSTFSAYKNVFLIRDPKELIASFCTIMEKPTLVDIGFKAQWERFETLMKKGHSPVVIDSGVLLENPEALLKTFCKKVSFCFNEKMLSWEKGPIKEDGSWAKYWYAHVHNSTGFSKRNNGDIILSEYGQELYEEALPYYEKLLKYSLQIG